MKKQPVQKELLTTDKMRDLFGAQYQFMRWYNYDTRLLDNGQSPYIDPFHTQTSFARLRHILKRDARVRNYELVAVVALSIFPGPYIGREEGLIIRNPTYYPPNTKMLGATGYAGTLVFRSRKTGKILPMPQKWLYTGFSTCVVPGLIEPHFTYMMNLAYLLDHQVACQDYDTYEKMIRIHFRERGYE